MNRDAFLALADELRKSGRANWTHPKRQVFAERLEALAAQPDVQSEPKAERVNEYGEPEVIYLQLHGDGYRNETKPSDYQSGEVTWCWHAINNDDVRYIRADLAQPDVQSEWQDIESAPKDGTEVFVFAGRGVHSASFDAGDWYIGSYEACDPTHWMPLPPPPKDKP